MSDMDAWEYKVDCGMRTDDEPGAIKDYLNACGQEGWQLVWWVHDRMVFKREVRADVTAKGTKEATWDGQRWYRENAFGEGDCYYWSAFSGMFYTQDAGTKGCIERGEPLEEREVSE